MTTEPSAPLVPPASPFPGLESAPSPALSPTVRSLGIVSLFADVSSEMVYPLNPVFITQVLGAPPWALGIIEGVAESTASLLKLASGRWSDRMGRRKPLAVAGYAFGAIGKPLIALASAWRHVLVARFVDRVGKGLRTAPRDALIAENCPKEQRGRAFGFHRSMDTVGAVLGPLIGFLVLRFVLHDQRPDAFRSLYWLAFGPGLLSVIILALAVNERKKPGASAGPGADTAQPASAPMPAVFRRYLVILGIFSLGNSSDAFLLLRAGDMGVAPAYMLLLYAVFNVVEAALGYPAGRLSDRVPRRRLISAGYVVFGVVYLGFALLNGPMAVWVLFPFYGFYYTLTQGVQRALAADLSDPEHRGAHLGAFHMVVGLAALPASIAAGWLYTLWQPAPFILGAVTAFLAAVLLAVARLEPPIQAST